MKNGPAEAYVNVHKDFKEFTSIKKGKGEKGINGHSVKFIGWGVEKYLAYWVGINIWDEKWGMKGTSKILRGHNECKIDSMV
ncbi:Peptidase C1 domain containing protein [Asbolus verrucosus]|uniref:Peptidase C1 domain containing protein n=1 Tax=Asbolus verrucosus TaxID=1661398 RepID=A0A482VIZ4_ASBVE|nr:Peptidase C1 domain containing protein [Asbolus verrucosus]